MLLFSYSYSIIIVVTIILSYIITIISHISFTAITTTAFPVNINSKPPQPDLFKTSNLLKGSFILATVVLMLVLGGFPGGMLGLYK